MFMIPTQEYECANCGHTEIRQCPLLYSLTCAACGEQELEAVEDTLIP